jgi:hypothetical protein
MLNIAQFSIFSQAADFIRSASGCLRNIAITLTTPFLVQTPCLHQQSTFFSDRPAFGQ